MPKEKKEETAKRCDDDYEYVQLQVPSCVCVCVCDPFFFLFLVGEGELCDERKGKVCAFVEKERSAVR